MLSLVVHAAACVSICLGLGGCAAPGFGRHQSLVVSDATIVRRVLVLTKLDESVPFDATVAEAVAHCSDPEEHES